MYLLLCLLLPLSLLAAEPTEVLSTWGQLKVGDVAPPFGSFDVAHGGVTVGLKRVLDLPEVKGVVLTVFGTYCLPCRKGLQILQGAKAELELKGIRVLAMSFLEDEEAVKAYIKGHTLDLVILTDKFGANLKSYGFTPENKTALPKTFLLAKDRRILKILGSEGEDFLAVIEQTLGALKP